MATKMLEKSFEAAGKSIHYLEDTLQKMPFDFLEDGDDIRVDIEDQDSIIDRIVALMENVEDKIEDDDVNAQDLLKRLEQDLLKRIEEKFETALELMEKTNEQIISAASGGVKKRGEDDAPADPQLTQVENAHWFYKQALTHLEDSYASFVTAKEEEIMR
jgi:hypothetical protein